MMYIEHFTGLYFKPMTIVNDNSRVINKIEASLTDDARFVIYDRQMFIVVATGLLPFTNFKLKFKISILTFQIWI